jgi:lysophospholipase L1-like esterase
VRRTFITLFVVGLGCLVALVVGQLVVQLGSKHFLKLYDVEMWRYARLVKHESAEPGVVEEHWPNANAVLMGASVRTDAHGFRRADPHTEGQRNSTDRMIVALGDSLTLGWGVPEGQTYADQLERLLNERSSARGRVTVLNAGIGNSNTAMELARFQRYIRPLHPTWLVLGFFINDAEPDPLPSHNWLLEHSALLSLVFGQLRVRINPKYTSYQAYYSDLYSDKNPGWIRCQEALAELGRLLREDGTPATLLLLPEMHEPKDFGPFAEIYAKAAALGVRDGFEVLDASKGFPPGPGTSFWVSRDDAHPDAAAQALFARALAESRYASGETGRLN